MKCGICNKPTELWEDCGVICEDCADKPRYKYFSTLRPPSKFAVPDGWCLNKVWGKPGQIRGSRIMAHGWVEYPEPLPFETIWHYDFLPADENEVRKFTNWCRANRR